MDPVLDYIYSRELPLQQLLLHLHQIITSYPGATSRIRYKIPFYYRNSWVCYLNPQGSGVELCFLRGQSLSNEQGILQHRDRKQVAGILYNKLHDIVLEDLHSILAEAFLLDEQVQSAKRARPTQS